MKKKFTTASEVATVSFQILESAKIPLNLDFTTGVTSDSNVAEHASAKDLLTSVVGGEYSVQATPSAQTLSILKKALPFIIVGFGFFTVAGIIFWFLRRRSSVSTGDVFYPQQVPLDQIPDEVKTEQATSEKPNSQEGS